MSGVVWRSSRASELEQVLARELRASAERAPFGRRLVLVPHHWGRRALLRRLGELLERPVLGLEVVTLHQVAMRLAEAAGASLPPPVSLTVQQLLIRQVLTGAPDEAMRSWLRFEGIERGLSRSLFELLDAGLDIELARELLDDLGVVAEGLSAQAREGIRRVLWLFIRWREPFLNRRPCRQSDAYRRVLEILDSTDTDVAGTFGELHLYGWIRVQSTGERDLLQRLLRSVPSTAYLPHPADPTWGGAGSRPILDELYLGAGMKLHDVGNAEAEVPPVELRGFSASGISGEVGEIAVRIQRLLAAEPGLPLHRIGVVLRRIEPYLPAVSRVFTAHRIPWQTTGRLPGNLDPAVRTFQAILDCIELDFPREVVFEALAAGPASPPDTLRGKMQQLDLVCRLCNVVGGDDWRRLAEARTLPRDIRLPRAKADAELDEDSDIADLDREEPSPAHLRISSRDVTDFARWILQLRHLSRRLWPEEAGWREHVLALERLLEAWSWARSGPENGDESSQGQIMLLLESMADWSELTGELPREAFLGALRQELQRVVIPAAGKDGVVVIGAAEAIGSSFDHLFLCGLSRGSFPLPPSEDPHLSEDSRVALRALLPDLPLRSSQWEEERLLFGLMLGSANRILTVSYPRSDEEGRPTPPSIYLVELQQRAELRGAVLELENIPRNRRQRLAALIEAGHALSLPPEDLILHFGLNHGAAGLSQLPKRVPALLRARYANGAESLFEHWLTTVREQDQISGLTRFDVLGRGPAQSAILEDLGSRPLSASRLQVLLRCPYQYFARQILQAQTLEEVTHWTLDPAAEGLLMHEILERYCRAVIEGRRSPRRELLDETAGEVFQRFEQENLIGLPGLWRIRRDELQEILWGYLGAEPARLAAEGRRPESVEQELAGWLELPDGSRIQLSARADRLDRELQQRDQ